MTIFERYAREFPLVSDECARWNREGALLVELALDAGSRKGRILDLACGSGFHSRYLSKAGFSVTGLDLSREALNMAAALPYGDSVTWIHGDITQNFNQVFDLILLVGNSLCLLEHGNAVKAVANAAHALEEGGAFLLHIIDFDTIWNDPPTIRRRGEVDARPVTIEKRIIPDDTGAIIHLTIEHLVNGKTVRETQTEKLQGYSSEDLRHFASLAGLTFVSEFGSLDKADRIPGVTKDIVQVYRRYS